MGLFNKNETKEEPTPKVQFRYVDEAIAKTIPDEFKEFQNVMWDTIEKDDDSFDNITFSELYLSYKLSLILKGLKKS